MKYYLDPPSEELKKFKFSINKTFGEIGTQEPVLWRPSKRARKRAILKSFIKRLEKHPIGMNLYRPNKNTVYRRPQPPAFEYIMNDVGENSNDSISKYFLAQMHNQTKDLPDIRDWRKPYIPKTIEKLME